MSWDSTALPSTYHLDLDRHTFSLYVFLLTNFSCSSSNIPILRFLSVFLTFNVSFSAAKSEAFSDNCWTWADTLTFSRIVLLMSTSHVFHESWIYQKKTHKIFKFIFFLNGCSVDFSVKDWAGKKVTIYFPSF